jgi:hypothetical protein
MYKKLSLILIFALSMYMPNMAFSHGDHDYAMDEAQALKRAIKYTGMIIDLPNAIEGVQLNESWRALKQASVHEQTEQYFIVSVHNAGEEKTLFLLLSSSGELEAANFDGEFE